MLEKVGSVPEVVIRTAGLSDVAGILRCLSLAFAPYQQDYTPEAFLDTVLDPERLHDRMQEMHILVAGSNGEVVGTIAGAAMGNGEGHLRGMAVLPEARGLGIAARLLAGIEDWLRQHGCTRVSLDTTPPLLAAMKFYEKHGYTRSGRATDFFGMPLLEYEKQIR